MPHNRADEVLDFLRRRRTGLEAMQRDDPNMHYSPAEFQKSMLAILIYLVKEQRQLIKEYERLGAEWEEMGRVYGNHLKLLHGRRK